MEAIVSVLGGLILSFLIIGVSELGRIAKALEERNKQTFKDDK